jgi:hypothetical protein
MRNLSENGGPESKQRKSGHGCSGTHLANKGPCILELVRRFKAMASGSPGAKVPAQEDKCSSMTPQLAQWRMAGSLSMTPPAPALAVVASVVELGGQENIVSRANQQNPNSKGEGCTLRMLEKTNSCEVRPPPHFCPDAARSFELTRPTYAHLDVAFVPAP